MLPKVKRGQTLIEKVLSNQQTDYQELADSIVDVFFELDGNLRYIFWNKASEKLTGVPARQALGKSPENMFPDSPGTRRAAGLYLEVLKTQQPRSMVKRFHITGQELYFEIHAYPSKRGVAVIARDITERKKAETALRASEARYHTLFQSMTEGFALHEIICDAKGAPVDYLFLDVNPSFERMTGLRRGDVVGKTMRKVLPEDDQQWIKIYGQVALTGQSVHFEKRSPALQRHYDVFAYCPAPGQFAVVFTDITGRKLVEEALLESEARYHGLFESIASGVVMQDRQGFILEANAAARDLLGLTEDETLGRTLPDPGRRFIREDGSPVTAEDHPALATLRTGKAARNVIMGVAPRQSGQCRWVLVNAEPIPDPAGGQPKAVVTTFLDITERKRAEEVLQRDKSMIEKLADQRSRELIAARIELEKARRLSDIGSLAAIIAHELRNPLSAINLAVANIKKKAASEALDRHLLTIEKKVLESDQIINNLLFYARIRPPARESVLLADILDECLDLAQKQFKKAVNVIKKTEPLRGLVLLVDPVQIKEVFVNLLNNAHDAVPDTGGKIKISGQADADGVRIRLQDNGKGIGKEDREKIFEPFFTTKARGTGLGLTVCRQIIDMHGGSIRIASRIGRGTFITVRLPKNGPAGA